MRSLSRVGLKPVPGHRARRYYNTCPWRRATMTLLLASVTGPEEAAVALAHGADIIDLKDASRGALGALDRDVLRATVAADSGKPPVSAVTGHLPPDPDATPAP